MVRKPFLNIERKHFFFNTELNVQTALVGEIGADEARDAAIERSAGRGFYESSVGVSSRPPHSVQEPS